ncbi:vegetative cell wall protein gp1-like [Tachyglossus aculeatus]|uniref:vegetative cell wall protein gp1-like n=1 Tax=Tachyglossus aculeatus TaxID=9261 RepID=UPI0018F4A479|nr:vegetative cell wall protein gp1-like [Tachyglossus aculeatus]
MGTCRSGHAPEAPPTAPPKEAPPTGPPNESRPPRAAWRPSSATLPEAPPTVPPNQGHAPKIKLPEGAPPPRVGPRVSCSAPDPAPLSPAHGLPAPPNEDTPWLGPRPHESGPAPIIGPAPNPILATPTLVTPPALTLERTPGSSDVYDVSVCHLEDV